MVKRENPIEAIESAERSGVRRKVRSASRIRPGSLMT
jgi:hypothetical protein